MPEGLLSIRHAQRSFVEEEEDLAGLAAERGVGELYGALHEGLSRLCDQVGTTQSNVTYRWRSPSGGRTALVSIYPKVSSPEVGLLADIRVEDLAKQLGIESTELRGALPRQVFPRQISGFYIYDEGYAFQSREEIDRFLAKLGGAAGVPLVDSSP
jgi:hypothetical protein